MTANEDERSYVTGALRDSPALKAAADISITKDCARDQARTCKSCFCEPSGGHTAIVYTIRFQLFHIGQRARESPSLFRFVADRLSDKSHIA